MIRWTVDGRCADGHSGPSAGVDGGVPVALLTVDGPGLTGYCDYKYSILNSIGLFLASIAEMPQ